MSADPTARRTADPDAAIKRITSPANAQVKAIRALHQKKYRAAEGRFLAEGLRILAEAVDQGHAIETLVVLPEMRQHRVGGRLIQHTAAHGGTVLEVTEPVLAKIARKDNPQGAVGVFPQRWERLEAVDAARDLCWAVLEGIRDPGNLGTILRTLDAVGGSGAILLDSCCDPYSIEGVRASMGSLFCQRLVHTDFESFQAWRRRQGGLLVGTSLNAARDYQQVSYPRPTFVLMGNEQSGLPQAYETGCDELALIPMRGRADSLNVSIAASVLLYEVLNQDRRRAAGGQG
jgi:TrmH family RNA methyltransferase